MIKITFLIENKTYSARCLGEHGLSLYIETDEKKILFDTGASSMFLENAKRKHIDLKDVDFCVISHGHYDHTEGVPYFCDLNENAPVYIHKNAFGDFYGSEDGVIDTRRCGILWDEPTKEKLKNRFILTDGVVWVTDNIVISGTIPRKKDSKMPEIFYVKKEDTRFEEDDMSHEQFLAVRDEKRGVFVFSGCSHQGIEPVIARVEELFPGERIAGVVAGLHLYNAAEEDIRAVVDKLKDMDLDMLMPVHCTGVRALARCIEVIGDKCIAASCGETYEYDT